MPLEQEAGRHDALGNVPEAAHLDDQIVAKPCGVIVHVRAKPSRRDRAHGFDPREAASGRDKARALSGRSGKTSEVGRRPCRDIPSSAG